MSLGQQSFSCILSLPLRLSRRPHNACESVGRRRPQLSTPLTALRLHTLHRAEDIGSALKGGVNVCQRQLVNEVLGPLVTEVVRNFGREDATPYQRSSNASLLGRVQALKLIRHSRSDFYPKAQIHKWRSKKCSSLSKKVKSFNADRSIAFYWASYI